MLLTGSSTQGLILKHKLTIVGKPCYTLRLFLFTIHHVTLVQPCQLKLETHLFEFQFAFYFALDGAFAGKGHPNRQAMKDQQQQPNP